MDKTVIFLIILITALEAIAMLVLEESANMEKRNDLHLIGLLLYLAVGYILYRALIIGELAMTNIIWNILSIIVITFIGIFYFKEKFTTTKWIGLGLLIISILFIEYDEIMILLGRGSN